MKKFVKATLWLSLVSTAISATYIAIETQLRYDGYRVSKEKLEDFYNETDRFGNFDVRFEWENPGDYQSGWQRGTIYYLDGSKSIRSYYLSATGQFPILASVNFESADLITTPEDEM